MVCQFPTLTSFRGRLYLFGIGMYVVLFFSSFFVLSRTRNAIVQSWVIRLATVLMLV